MNQNRFVRRSLSMVVLTTLFANIADAASVKTLRTPEGGIQPQAVVDASGTAHMIYFKGEAKAGELYYVRVGPDNQFTSPIIVTTPDKGPMAVGNIRGAQLAVGKNGRAHVAWMGGGKIMYYTRLNDAGTAFELPRNVLNWAGGLDGGGTIAADTKGDVYVAWHGRGPNAKEGELGRAVFITRSTDEGKTFSREEKASGSQDGVCGCCGMRGYADAKGNLYLLYRAWDGKSRDMILLTSTDTGKTFKSTAVNPWPITTCPMSSSTMTEMNGELLAATESDHQVSFVRIAPSLSSVEETITAPGVGKRKHPVILANAKGETLLAWTENMGWNKGGSLAWQLYNADRKIEGEKGAARGVPTWSLPTGFAKANGDFVLIY